MVSRDELIDFVHSTIGVDLLSIASRKDELANGVQIRGGNEVSVVALGVSLNEEFLKQAVAIGSNFSIFHHGFDVRTDHSRYSVSSQKRLGLIFQNNMTVAGCHYSLDAHPVIGNNAVIIQQMGGKIINSLFDDWGFVARFPRKRRVSDIFKQCQLLFGTNILSFRSKTGEIDTFGVVSGAGKPYQAEIEEMVEKGVQLFISGETSESVPHRMVESEIYYIVCGHYATEMFGVKALGEEIKREFGERVGIEFIDIPNPV